MARHRFIWKSFVSFLVLLGFAGLSVTGAVLYVAPAGRVANWSEWTLFALQKEQWQAVHTVLATLFLAGATVHLVLNWPVLRAYLKMRVADGTRRRREWLAASITAVVLAAVAVADLPPSAQIMDLGEAIKAAWGGDGNEPPVPHAELLPVAKVAELRKVATDATLANLRDAGFEATAERTLGEIAASRGVAPSEVYRAMTAGLEQSAAPRVATGGGFGRKTVMELSEQLQVPSAVALERLRREGITAQPDSNVRELAMAHGRLPTDLVTIISTP